MSGKVHPELKPYADFLRQDARVSRVVVSPSYKELHADSIIRVDAVLSGVRITYQHAFDVFVLIGYTDQAQAVMGDLSAYIESISAR